MITLRNAERIQSHKSEISFLPIISSCLEKIRMAAAAPIQMIPITIPDSVPFPMFSFIGMFMVFFSISQKATVNSIMTANGISSAKNLHTAGLSLGISMIPDSTAHPIKKTTIFTIVINNFFKNPVPPNITCNYCILASPPFRRLSHSHNSPTSNSATQHSDIYRGNSTLTLFEPFCFWISYREAFVLHDAIFARLPEWLLFFNL